MYGLGLLKALVVLIALALFVVPWGKFAWDTWNATATVDFNDGLVYLGNLSAGVLASAFAIVLGVKAAGRTDGFGTLLSWPKAPDWAKLALTACVWLYFLIGAFVLSAYVRDLLRDTSYGPAELKDFALVFAGYTVTYLAVLIGVPRQP
jgi:hypothetical protein